LGAKVLLEVKIPRSKKAVIRLVTTLASSQW